jgi:hypothetical protein
MQAIKKQIAIGVYLVLMAVCCGLFVVTTTQTARAAGGICIYAEYRYPILGCVGATTRLCEGPPDCPIQQ